MSRTARTMKVEEVQDMRKETQQAIKNVLKLDSTVSPIIADTVMCLLGYIAIPERKRKRKDEPGEEVLKALVDFLEYAKSKAGDPECLNMRSLTKYCITTYGYKIGNEVYDLFRGRIDTLHFKISKRDNRNLYFEYIGKP